MDNSRISFIAQTLLLVPVAFAQNASNQLSPELIASQISQGRAAKDSFLVSASESPFTEEMKKGFEGLQYFPVDLAFRIEADLHIYGRPRRVPVTTNLESVIEMDRFGRLVGSWTGNPFSLEVFRNLQDGSILVLFKDATNGSETYSAGRYVRVEDVGSGRYLIDFNNSYNPYCAYNTDYVCPMPPLENTLSFAVRAGEMDIGANLAY